jgi:iron complex outermembrane receptor protein
MYQTTSSGLRGLYRTGVSRIAVTLAIVVVSAPVAAAAQSPATAPATESPPVLAGSGTPSSDPAPAKGEDIVVTGSRIARRDYASNTPIVTLSQEALDTTSSFALETKLQQLPQFAGSASSQFSAGYLNSGVATLNLRNLGDNRNLVLIDGRRAQPSTSSFAIDINTIPSALVENVEVISGGASAVYGADAVSGVVNFRLKQKYQGFHVGAQYGISELGDNRVADLEALIGTNFAEGRGNAVLAANFSQRGAFYNGSRSFYQRGLADGRNGSTLLASGYFKPTPGNLPTQGAVNAYFGQFGAPASGVRNTTNVGFNNDGTTLFNLAGSDIYNFQNPLVTRFAIDRISSPGVAQVKESFDDALLSTPLKRYSFFGRGSYDVTDSVALFVQGNYTTYDSRTQGGPVQADNFWQNTIPRDAAHPVPAGLAALLDSRPNPAAPWILGKALDFLGPRVVLHDLNVFQLTGGLKGKIGGTDWTWEAYGSHGETKIVDTGVRGFANTLKLQELMTAPNYGAGYSGSAGKCTSGIYPFGGLSYSDQTAAVNSFPTAQQQVSADCVAFISERPTYRTKLKQDVFEATMQGGLMELPYGQLRFATGASHRRNSYDYVPDPLTRPRADSSTVLMGQFGTLPVSGSTNVTEGYAELLIPLLANLPLIQSLEVDVAYRYSKYRYSGGAQAYKADLSWQVFDALRVRGGYQRAVRAPNVVELFSPSSQSSGTGIDPCQANTGLRYGNTPQNTSNRAQVQALCRTLMGAGAPTDLDNYLGASVPTLTASIQGNPDLNPEKADTYTLGAVFRPRWKLPLDAALSLSVDYYNIKIAGAIGFISGQQTYDLCFNSNGLSNPGLDATNRYCQAIGRSTAPGSGGAPTIANTLYDNQGGIHTSGIDIQADLSLAAGPGRLTINAIANYLDSFTRSPAVGSPFLEYAGYSGGYFQWKLFDTATYSIDGYAVGLRWRHLTGVKNIARVTAPCTPGPMAPSCRLDTPNHDGVDLFGRAKINDQMSFRAGIDNLLNAEPALVGGIPGTTDPANYDIIGRRFFIGVTFDL